MSHTKQAERSVKATFWKRRRLPFFLDPKGYLRLTGNEKPEPVKRDPAGDPGKFQIQKHNVKQNIVENDSENKITINIEH